MKRYLFFLFLSNFLHVLHANNLNLVTQCTLSKLEADFNQETIRETKKCILGLASSTENECAMIHEITFTTIVLKNKIDNEKKINVEMNNMNEKNPLTWNIKVDINNKTKTLINMGSEKINVHCLGMQLTNL